MTTLHVIAASHPCAAVEAALRIKGLEHRRIELPNLLHRPLQRLRYGRPTVAGLTLAHPGRYDTGRMAGGGTNELVAAIHYAAYDDTG